MARIIIVWGLWGPYHCRRFEAFRDHAENEGHEVTGVSLFSGSRDYQWRREALPDRVVHIELGADETRFPFSRIGRLLSIPWKLRPDAALLPSYDHWSLALNGATRARGGRVVMMNDTHAGTARARGLKAAFKRRVVAGFHAAFVAGSPQRRYFSSLGLHESRIFTGYDAVDNDYFSSQAAAARNDKRALRLKYGLPEHYFLSLGRFVPKKNLSTLIKAYRIALDSKPACRAHLVLVGSGEEDFKLRSLCKELCLTVYDKTAHGSPNPVNQQAPAVHFYGFRQIEESPAFYALADAFVLPSAWEEWGLVVNEAMACGLPVVVSQTAGCAEDLLPHDGGEQPVTTNVGIRKNGCVFDPHSPESLASALQTLDADPVFREAMGKASIGIIKNFSCEAFARNALMAARAAIGEPVFSAARVSPPAGNRQVLQRG